MEKSIRILPITFSELDLCIILTREGIIFTGRQTPSRWAGGGTIYEKETINSRITISSYDFPDINYEYYYYNNSNHHKIEFFIGGRDSNNDTFTVIYSYNDLQIYNKLKLIRILKQLEEQIIINKKITVL